MVRRRTRGRALRYSHQDRDAFLLHLRSTHLVQRRDEEAWDRGATPTDFTADRFARLGDIRAPPRRRVKVIRCRVSQEDRQSRDRHTAREYRSEHGATLLLGVSVDALAHRSQGQRARPRHDAPRKEKSLGTCVTEGAPRSPSFRVLSSFV